MTPFTTHRGIVAVLDRANIDTDQIIPKQFLKSIKKTGFGDALFFDWKYRADGSLDPAFPLNDETAKQASILVVRNNFGCGSSREHAVWAVLQAGFKVVIAPWVERNGNRIPAFADIFAGNAVKNGLLTVALTEDEVEDLFLLAGQTPALSAFVDLAAQEVGIPAEGGRTFRFDIDPAVKEYLLKGLDEIGLTLEKKERIAAFEGRQAPWLKLRAKNDPSVGTA